MESRWRVDTMGAGVMRILQWLVSWRAMLTWSRATAASGQGTVAQHQRNGNLISHSDRCERAPSTRFPSWPHFMRMPARDRGGASQRFQHCSQTESFV